MSWLFSSEARQVYYLHAFPPQALQVSASHEKRPHIPQIARHFFCLPVLWKLEFCHQRLGTNSAFCRVDNRLFLIKYWNPTGVSKECNTRDAELHEVCDGIPHLSEWSCLAWPHKRTQSWLWKGATKVNSLFHFSLLLLCRISLY